MLNMMRRGAALALLMASGIPGQVVMHNCVEVLLKIYAFAETVGADEDAAGRFGKLFDACLAVGWR